MLQKYLVFKTLCLMTRCQYVPNGFQTNDVFIHWRNPRRITNESGDILDVETLEVEARKGSNPEIVEHLMSSFDGEDVYTVRETLEQILKREVASKSKGLRIGKPKKVSIEVPENFPLDHVVTLKSEKFRVFGESGNFFIEKLKNETTNSKI